MSTLDVSVNSTTITTPKPATLGAEDKLKNAANKGNERIALAISDLIMSEPILNANDNISAKQSEAGSYSCIEIDGSIISGLLPRKKIAICTFVVDE